MCFKRQSFHVNLLDSDLVLFPLFLEYDDIQNLYHLVFIPVPKSICYYNSHLVWLGKDKFDDSGMKNKKHELDLPTLMSGCISISSHKCHIQARILIVGPFQQKKTF